MKDYSKHYFRLLQGMALSVSDYIRNQKPIVIIVFLLVHSISIYAQDNTISGLVKDNEGEPLPGVSVAVKAGESISGVVTDINGKYQLKASPNATIEFSFIGFKSIQQQVGNRKVINVTLEIDNQMLEEVVVVRYSKKGKSYRFRKCNRLKSFRICTCSQRCTSTARAGSRPEYLQ